MADGFHSIGVETLGAFVPVSEELLLDINPDHYYHVCASSFQVAGYYAKAVGASGARIVTRPEQLRGLAKGAHILYVNDDAGGHSISLVRKVQQLEAVGVTVDWLGGVPTEYRS